MSSNTGLNTLGFIQANSLTYPEILNDVDTFIEALSEDERNGFKTQFEGTSSQILKELIAAKSSDEIYHIITSRSENLLYYCNRIDSATAIAQNNAYSVNRGSNICLSITLTPSETVVLSKLSPIAVADEYDLIIAEDLALTAGESITFNAYLGSVNEQTLTADTEDYLVFRFTNSNISEQCALYLNNTEVPTTENILEMLNDKYFLITNSYGGVDAIYLNSNSSFTHRYTNGSELKLRYIEYENITLSSIDIESTYGEITNVVQLSSTAHPETVASVRTNAQLYAETQNRIVARDDFQKVFQYSNPEIVNAVGQDFSSAQVEVTYVKENGELLTDTEYQAAYNNLSSRRAYGIPMCLLSHPDIMLNLDVTVILQLLSGNSALVPQYVRQVLAQHELQLGALIDFSQIENELEGYSFVKTARIVPRARAFAANTLMPEGTVIKPTTPNGKLYVVRNPLFLTGESTPSWSTAIGSTTTDNDVIWTTEARSYAYQQDWEPQLSVRLQSVVWVDSLPSVQFRCTRYTYKTGASEPVWPTTEGEFVSDGQILWISVSKNITAKQWAQKTITDKGDIVNATHDTPVSYQAINYIPTTPNEEPTWSTNLSIYTDKNIQYACINEEYDPTNAEASNIQLNWNQYVRFNEEVQVIA